MHFNYFIYIVILLLSNSRFTVADEGVKTYSIDDKVSGCSTWLSTIIYLLCDNTFKIVKRDTTSLMIDILVPKDLQLEIKRQRLVNDGQRRRERRQVADECCTRPCTVADIITYCPNDAKLVLERPDIFEQ